MYKAILIAPDGDWVTDFERNTVEEVEQELANMGSRWYFYPFHAVIKSPGSYIRFIDRKRLVSVAWPFEDMKGMTVGTLRRMIATMPEERLEAILS